MYSAVSVVGERGQITIPKLIRDAEGLKSKDKVLLRLEGNKITLEKLSTQTKGELMKEFYVKYAELNKQINDEWQYVSTEADELL